jgi:RNA polymerase sigma-70 factor (ECF subfamily)
MLSDSDIAKECLQKKYSAQKELYNRYSKKMHAVCRRYLSDKDTIKDVLQEGFIKVFNNIDKYRGDGPLESWIRRIIINTALTSIRRNNSGIFLRVEENEEEDHDVIQTEEEDESVFNGNFSEEDLLKSIEALPENYKIVFNLFCLENHSHKEISEMLSIKEESSRTRLNRARKILQEHLLSIHKEYLAKQNT